MKDLQSIIDTAFENRANINPQNVAPFLKEAIDQIVHDLEMNKIRVAEPIIANNPLNGATHSTWITHEWIKKAILLYFRIYDSTTISGGFTQFFDKIPLRFTNATPESFAEASIRIVPPATVRRGTYIAKNTILMPCFVNIGASIGEGSMIDTWVTVGSCAQIGKRVHLSGGVGIGGVLEPLQSHPTIIEDDCFIGARSEIVEGVIIEKGAVISMGVYLSQSTKIYNRESGEITYGRIPSNSVVVPGTLPSLDGKYSMYCAIIVKQVDDRTRQKTAINELLRF